MAQIPEGAANFHAMLRDWRSIAEPDGATTPAGRALLDACSEAEHQHAEAERLRVERDAARADADAAADEVDRWRDHTDATCGVVAERDELAAKNERLRAELNEYERAIVWDTACTEHARLLDAVWEAEEQRDVLRAALGEARDALRVARRVVATSSRDWSLHADDVWLYALIVGWDCELPEHSDGEHDPIDCSGPDHLERFAERFGWTEGGIAKLRKQRRALAALDAPETPEQLSPARRRELLRDLTFQAVDAGMYGEPAPEMRPAPETPGDTEGPATRLVRCDRHATAWSGSVEMFQDCPDCREVPGDAETEDRS